MAVHDVDPHAYASASTTMDGVGSSARSAVSTLGGALGSSGGMAGSDKPGESFSQEYDPAAKKILESAAGIVNSASNYAVLLHATGSNHAGADADSTIGGGDSSLSGVPSSSSFSAPSSPASYGGTKEPDGLVAHIWHMIESYVGYVWPRGHQDQLRSAGGAWKTAASSIRTAGDQITSALALINAQQAPEVSLAAQKHTDLKKNFDNVVEGCQSLASSCEEYAQFIDDAHEELVELLLQAAAETAATHAIGIVSSFFTFGGGEAVAATINAGRLMMYAKRAAGFIKKLWDAVKRVVEPLGKLKKLLAELGSKLGRGGKAVEKAGEGADDLKGLLTQHAKDAVDKFDQGIIKLSPRQQRAVNKNPGMLNTHKGNVLDKEMKRTVSQDPALQDRVEVTGLFRRGPDFKVKDPEAGKPAWYDLTTSGQRQAHLDRYEPDFGKGDTIHWNEL